jgi:hypothetical protein
MRLPRLRFTVRRLMIAVAIVALLMGGSLWIVQMRTRSASYRQRAFEFAVMTARSGSGILTKDGRWVSRYDNENDWLRDAWACKLAEKYWGLSHYPWLPVEPDPPPPERLARPRPAVDLPAELQPGCWSIDLDAPWWTFLWTWRPQ